MLQEVVEVGISNQSKLILAISLLSYRQKVVFFIQALIVVILQRQQQQEPLLLSFSKINHQRHTDDPKSILAATTVTAAAATTSRTNKMSAKPVVICGPSGVGKGTLIEMLMQHFPDGQFGFSVSHTTRLPREGEVDGVHYNFTTIDSIRKDIADNKFIEYAEVHGKYYGTR